MVHTRCVGRTARLALAAAVVLGVIGCGGDDDSSSGSASQSGSGGGADAPALTGDPIKIMTISTISTPNLQFGETADAVAARVEALNAAGGINGSPVEAIACDERNDPNTAADCARQAVEEGVVATVGDYTLQGESVWPTLEAVGIPRIGLRSVTPTDGTSELSFPVDSTVATVYVALAKVLIEEQDCEGITIVGPDAAATHDVADRVEEATEDAGATFAGAEFFPASGPPADLVPMATELVDNGATCALTPVGSALQAQFSQAFLQADPDIRFGVAAVGMPEDWAESIPDVDRFTVIDAMAVLGSDEPGMQAFRDQMEEYAPDAALTSHAVRSWVGADVFAQVAETIEGDVTSESLVAALNEANSIDTGGITAPIDFTEPHETDTVTREFNTQFRLQVAVDGEAQNEGDLIDAYAG